MQAWEEKIYERQEAWEEGREEGREEEHTNHLNFVRNHLLKLLSIRDSISSELESRIMTEQDSDLLDSWFTIAITASSIDDFIEKTQILVLQENR